MPIGPEGRTRKSPQKYYMIKRFLLSAAITLASGMGNSAWTSIIIQSSSLMFFDEPIFSPALLAKMSRPIAPARSEKPRSGL